MTCIVGLEHEGAVYLGGDSALSDADTGTLRVLREPKVFINLGVAFGCCSDLRAQQLLQYVLNVPDRDVEQLDDMEWLVTHLMGAVRALQKKKGTVKVSESVDTQEMQFLVGYRGHLYTVEENFQVYRSVDAWASVGSGSDLAMGSMHSTAKVAGLSPEQRITMALEAAEAYNGQVRRPFHIVKLEPEKE